MRRRILTVCLIAMFMASPLVGKSLGYGLGMYGQRVVSDERASSGGAELSFVYQPWLLPLGNPSLFIKGAMGFDMDNSLTFPYLELGLSVDIFRTIDHPFNFFANNIIAYDPALSVSYYFDVQEASHLLGIGVSPFKLSQKDFWYEFFAFYAAVDVGTSTVANWGIHLFRYTYLFK